MGCLEDFLINAPALGYLLEQCQSLKSLKLRQLTLDENHCHVLGGYSRPGLEIVLSCCRFTKAGTSALVELLGRNQGPTRLDLCFVDNSVVANGLRGNNRLKSFRPNLSCYPDACKRDVLAIADALKENKGLVDLDLSSRHFREDDEAWGAICDSLKTHPTLEVLNLSSELMNAAQSPALIRLRIKALSKMMKINLSIHTIRLRNRYSEHELFQGSVLPYLETNMLHTLLLVIQNSRPISYRAKVLGRALLAARSNANSFWMLLSGNAEVAFPSTSANRPTTATAATTSTAVASVMSTLTTTVTGSLSKAGKATATSAPTPSTATASGAFDPTIASANSGQKRKTCP
jgi:hypothetical protein